MNDVVRAFLARARQLHLEPSEKAASKASLLSFMSEHPVRGDVPQRLRDRMETTEFFRLARDVRLAPREHEAVYDHIHNEMQRTTVEVGYKRRWWHVLLPPLRILPVLASMLGVFAVVGTGISYAAETALPGELLYPMKVHVNEPLWAVATLSSEGKVRWRTRRAERRLEEAEALAVRSRLKTEVRVALATNLNVQVESAREALVILASQGGSEAAAHISASFEASLQAHEETLAHIARGKQGARGELQALLIDVRRLTRRVVAVREDVERTFVGSLPQRRAEDVIAQVHVKAASERVKEMRSSFTRIEGGKGKRLGNSDRSEKRMAEARLEAAEAAVNEAGQKLSVGEAAEASALGRAALSTAEEAGLLEEVDRALQSEEGEQERSGKAEEKVPVNVPTPAVSAVRFTEGEFGVHQSLEVARRRIADVRRQIKLAARRGADTSKAERKLVAAEKILQEARARLRSHDEAGAFALARASVQLSQDASLLFDAAIDPLPRVDGDRGRGGQRDQDPPTGGKVQGRENEHGINLKLGQ